jgi:hypothetical protein
MRVSLLFVLTVDIAMTVPIAAHHSHNNYAISGFTPLQGVVRDRVYLQVKYGKAEPQL